MDKKTLIITVEVEIDEATARYEDPFGNEVEVEIDPSNVAHSDAFEDIGERIADALANQPGESLDMYHGDDMSIEVEYSVCSAWVNVGGS